MPILLIKWNLNLHNIIGKHTYVNFKSKMIIDISKKERKLQHNTCQPLQKGLTIEEKRWNRCGVSNVHVLCAKIQPRLVQCLVL